MSNSDSVMDMFPPLPGYKVWWQPVILEPIPGGPERFTVAIAAVGEDGAYRVVPTIDRAQFRKVFGKAGRGFADIVERVVANLHEGLERTPELDAHAPAFSGFYFGERSETVAESIDEILQTAVQRCSVFNLQYLDESITAAAVDKDAQPAKWRNQITEAFERQAPQLSHALFKRLPVSEAYTGVEIDFLGAKVGANFGKLDPKKISASTVQCRAKLWILQVSRDFLTPFAPKRFELFVVAPTKNDRSLKRSQFENIDEAISELAFEAEKEELRVNRMSSIDSLVQRLTGLEAM